MANPAPAETLPSGLRPGEPATSLIDDTPVTGFHRRLTAFCSGGPFLDGFALGVVGLALPQIARQWQLSGLWQGALAAAALLGILVGGLVFGYVTDLVGRKVMYSSTSRRSPCAPPPSSSSQDPSSCWCCAFCSASPSAPTTPSRPRCSRSSLPAGPARA
ncbi:hypothetical protein ACFQ0X_27795 [Streptomyces rectiviolaceus]|uniref:hypothetical protein n=1 Tax=Streptomyces rectiviolaceus TaxID=332591 RepID=UPI00363C2303